MVADTGLGMISGSRRGRGVGLNSLEASAGLAQNVVRILAELNVSLGGRLRSQEYLPRLIEERHLIVFGEGSSSGVWDGKAHKSGDWEGNSSDYLQDMVCLVCRRKKGSWTMRMR